jgi:DNA-directed RNA polymerase subunit K/omega
MNADLLHAAGAVVSNDQILVNVVRLRVKQLSLGHRPLVAAPPGAGTADIALMEIIQNKISFAPAVAENTAVPLPAVVEFPHVPVKKKAA